MAATDTIRVSVADLRELDHLRGWLYRWTTTNARLIAEDKRFLYALCLRIEQATSRYLQLSLFSPAQRGE